MHNNSLHTFASRDELVFNLGNAICQQLETAIANNGYATMAVSGGNSPIPLFEYLSDQTIAWSAVTITLVDERWVDENHPDSNARLVKNHLLQNAAAKATFVPLYTGAETPFQAEDDVNDRLKDLHQPFDVVVLGMGEDGHTASFFPNAATLPTALDLNSQSLCCAITPPLAPHQRMTLTLATLLQAHAVFLLVTGTSKQAVLRQAMEPISNDAGLTQWINALPIRSIIYHYQQPLEIYYAD